MLIPVPPPPQVVISFDPTALGAVWDRYRELRRRRNRSDDSLARKIMRYLISYALRRDRIPSGDAAKIEQDLMKHMSRHGKSGNKLRKSRARARRRVSALAEKYRGTFAAYLVSRLNWQNANTAKKKNGSPAFWSKVGQFVGARKWSRNLHRAGFFPVLQRLKRVEDPGYLPKPKKSPIGSYSESFADDMATLIAENSARSGTRPGRPASDGIAVLASRALPEARADLVVEIQRWLALEERELAKSAGFRPAA